MKPTPSDLVRVGSTVYRRTGEIVAEYTRGAWYEPRTVGGRVIEYETCDAAKAAKYAALPVPQPVHPLTCALAAAKR